MIFTLLLGLTALAGMLFSRPPSEDDARGQALAVSFGIFRRAAWQFAHDNPEHRGNPGQRLASARRYEHGADGRHG